MGVSQRISFASFAACNTLDVVGQCVKRSGKLQKVLAFVSAVNSWRTNTNMLRAIAIPQRALCIGLGHISIPVEAIFSRP